jgi:hypothetical protein
MSGSPIKRQPTFLRDLKWSQTEKRIARNAFDGALKRRLAAVTQEAKRMARRIKQPSDLWVLESYLTEQRNEIDLRYDFRYSVLPLVFADLIASGWLSEEELVGLGEDKLEYVRRSPRR